jgi:hypothetical protein
MTTEQVFLCGCEKEELLTSFPMKHILSNSSSCPTIEIFSSKPALLFANIRGVFDFNFCGKTSPFLLLNLFQYSITRRKNYDLYRVYYAIGGLGIRGNTGNTDTPQASDLRSGGKEKQRDCDFEEIISPWSKSLDVVATRILYLRAKRLC